MPYPLPLTRTEAYLAYKAGVIQQSDLKPSLSVPRNGIDAWLAYWTGLAEDYPKREDGTPHILQEEEAYIAYLCGVLDTYPEKCLRRVGAYLRYLISARWGRPDHPLNREELYLSLIKTQFIPSGDPSSDIVIYGTAKAPFVDVKMYGDTYQQSYDGKNIIDYITGLIASGGGLTNTINSDGTITTTGKPNGNYNKIIEYYDLTPFLEDGATYTLSSTLYNNKTAAQVRRMKISDSSTYIYDTLDGAKSFTVDKSQYTYRMGILTNTMSAWGDESLTITKGYQLEKSASATSFEPYVGGVPSPNPDYPQAIQTVTGEQTVTVTGKNLLSDSINTTTTNSGTVSTIQSSTWTITKSGTGGISAAARTDYFPLNLAPGDKVTFSSTPVSGSFSSGTTFPQIIVYWYDADKTQIGYTTTASTSQDITAQAYSKTYTAPSNVAYFRVGEYIPGSTTGTTTGVVLHLQLELGSTATAYTPFSSTDYTIDLGSIELCKLGESQDYIWEDDGEWKIRKAIVTHLFDGSTNDGYYFNADQTNTLAVNLNPDKIDQAAFKYTSGSVISCMTASFRFVWGIGDVEHIYVTGAQQVSEGYNGNIRLYILKSRLDGYSASLTKAEKEQLVADWLTSNPLKVYYIPKNRATTDTVITNQNLINQLNALKQGGAEEGTTYIKVNATGPNLPGLLVVEAPKYE